MEEQADIAGATETPSIHRQQQITAYEYSGLVKWWRKRGYIANPFTWSNAADVDGDSFSDLFQLWHIDPNTGADLEGLGPTPTLDTVKSLDTNRPVLIYAPGGGGKTFYRRWAARQIEEEEPCALEIRNIGERIRTPENVTARALAVCIYDQACERLSIQKDPSPPKHINHVFRKCDEVLQRLSSNSRDPARVYVFIDDLDQLFDERASAADRNAQALAAIARLCKIAAERGGGEPLALRMFIPLQLKTPLRNRLEDISPRRIIEHTIPWSAKHCQAVVERRLDSYWKDGPGTGIVHISRLLAQDTHDEFHTWLQRQEGISPGCVIELLNRLAQYAYSRGVATELIDVELWKKFSRASVLTDLCAPDAPYPLGRPPFLPLRSFNWLRSRLPLGARLVRGILRRVFLLVQKIIACLARTSDWIQAFLLLSALLGSVLFVLWCLIESARLGQRPDLGGCLQKAWQLIRRHLPGGQ